MIVQAKLLVTPSDINHRRAPARAWRSVLLRSPKGTRAVRAIVRPSTAAALRLATLNGKTSYQVHLVARTDAGRRTFEALRFTGPRDALTPEEQGELNRAHRFHAAGNPKAADDIYTALLTKRPHERARRVELLVAQGRARVEQRRPEEALISFQTALKLDTRNALAQSAVLRLTEKRTRFADTAQPGLTTGRAAGAVPQAPEPLRDPNGREITPVPDSPGLAPAGGHRAPPLPPSPTTRPAVKRPLRPGVPPLPDSDPDTEPVTPPNTQPPPKQPARTMQRQADRKAQTERTEEELPPPPTPGLSGPK